MSNEAERATGYGPRHSAGGRWLRLVFDGDENQYEIWEVKFLAYLRTLGLKDTILSADNPDRDKNEECYAELIQFLNDKSLSLVMRDAADDGKKALHILRGHYASHGKPRIIALYKELTSLLKEPGETVTDYILRAEKAATSLRNANEVISDGLLIAMILKGLPESYKPFTIHTTQRSEELTFIQFKSRLRSYEETEKFENKLKSDNVMKVDMTAVTCYGCGNRGHMARDCRQKSTPKWCNYHRSTTHSDETCRRRAKWKDDVKQTSEKQDNYEEDQTMVFKVSQDLLPDNIKLNGIMVDCGATSRIITKEEQFTQFDKTFDPNKHFMELADGNKMNNVALKRGDAQIKLLNSEGMYIRVTLKNALLIPSYPQSIFSVQAATAHGVSVTFMEGQNELLCEDGTVFPIEVRMQYLGRLLDKVPSVSNLFTNPYRVRDVPLSDYIGGGKIKLREEGRVVLYKNSQCQSWHCLLMCPNTPTMSLRLFQVVSEDDAMNWFNQYALKLQPFYETLPLKAESVQPIVDCIRSHPDWSCAHIAVETGLRECLKHNFVQSLINSQDAGGQTPLHLACERGDLACVKQLLDESQARTDIKDRHGDTPMHCACKHDSAVIVEALCSRLCTGVDNLNDNGETPLHVACRLGRVESVKALLGGGAKCDVIGGRGYPIHIGMKYNEKGCVEEILQADSSQLQAEDALYGGTPLHWAKTAEMCRLLLENDCSVNYLSKTGESALHILTKRGRFEAAMVLLTHGADANLKGQDGNTALHLAMKMDHMNLIKALIVFGADVEIPNDLGETPGLIAARTSKGPNREILLDMLFNVGVQRFLPASPGCPPPMSSTAKPQGIGFDALMHVEAPGAGAMGPGRSQVDGKRKMDRLLCLDGGGIKGLVLIQMLIALEKEAGRPTRELFDWVAGTSTGGILALAIIHGKSLQYLRCLYFRMKEQVFKGSRPYETTPLENFLKKEFGEDTKMTDVQYPRVMVTSVLADRHPGELHIFRNYDPPSVPREPPYATSATFRPLTVPQGWEDEDVLIVGYTEEPGSKRKKVTHQEQLVWRAARCSGAAPTYFQPMGRFLDGGLLANNPTLDAITEIHQYNKALKAEGCGKDTKKLGIVMSLGTGKPPQVEVSSVNVFRPSNPLEFAKSLVGAKELLKMLVDCCTDSDGCAVDRAQAWCEMTDTLYQRLSPQLSQEVMLDEVSDSVLVDMLWETQMYLYEKRTLLQSVAQSLLDT